MSRIGLRHKISWAGCRQRLKRRHLLWGLCLLCSLSTPKLATNAAEQGDDVTGQLLVSTSEMSDPRFAETVIYMVKHNDEGAFGLVINRPMAKGPIEDLLKSFGIGSDSAKGEIILHYGGPVSPGAGFILHSDDVLLENSTKVADGIAMTADVKLLVEMSRGKGPRQALVMLGYAGWAPGQFEAELKAGAWFVVAADRSLIFGQDADKKWQQAMDKRKIPL